VLSLVLMPRFRLADARSVVSPEDVSRLQHVPFLAVVSPLVVERLVKQQTRAEVTAGAWLVRQGEPGEAFFVIESGRLEVTQNGSVLRELGPGDWFGELALLRDVPRTASIRALTDVSVVVIERGPFLSAITGVPQSVEAARTDARRYTDLDPDVPTSES
jgi:CRP-like cAMP-binding protein